MANMCVMNMGKRHRADVRGLQMEANREYEKPEQYKGHIDPSRTHENVYFEKSDDWQESIDDVLNQYGIKESKNSVVLITSVYSASAEWFATHTRDEAMEYFRACFEYEKQTKGVTINAVVHWDETTPHMQVATVPVIPVQDEKAVPIVEKDEDGNELTDEDGNPVYKRYEKGKSKGKIKYERKAVCDEDGNPVWHYGLSAKKVFGNRVAMSKRQTQFFEMCGKQFGMERGEIRVETPEVAKGHLTEAEYRAQAIEKDAREASDVILNDAKSQAGKVMASASRYARESEAEAKKKAEQIIKDAEDTAAQRRLKASQSVREASKLLDEARSTLDAVKALEEAQRSSEGAKLQRALEFMEGLNFKGSNLREVFERKELVFGHKTTPKRSRAEIESQMESLYDRMNKYKGNDGQGYDF